MNKKLFLGLLLTLVVLAGIPGALAVSKYTTAMQTVYGISACTTCHPNSGPPPYTAYGTLFSNVAHRSNTTEALCSIGAPPGATINTCTTPTPTPTPTLDGATLYATYCASCHNPLSSTTKPGRTAEQTQNAITGNIGGMGYLSSSLSFTQIQAIATVMAVAPTPTPTTTTTPAPTPVITDGATLYAAYCASCHNPLASTTKPGRTAEQTQTAITANIGGMGYLSYSLSSTQIQAIASVMVVAPTPTPTTTTTPAPTPVITDGATLYATYCASCHNPLASTTKPGRTAAQTQAAITANIGNMGYLSSSLSFTQVQAIASVMVVAPTPTPTTTTTPAPTPVITDGATLYATYCASCHNPLASTTKPGRTAAQTQAAITANIGNMGYLSSSLSFTQVQAIANVMVVAPTPTPTTTTTPATTPSITDGATLYATYCASCHNPLEYTTKPGRTAAQNQNAITGNIGGMGYLSSSLSSTQVQAISTAMAVSSIPTATTTTTLALSPASTYGATLYATYCASCHNPLESTTKPGRTAEQNQNAITGNIGGMGYLSSSLNSTQVQAISTAMAGSTQATAQTNGTALYAGYCASCHGQLANSTMLGRTAAQIQFANNEVSEMKFLSVLSSTQNQAISNVLAGVPHRGDLKFDKTTLSATVRDYFMGPFDLAYWIPLFLKILTTGVIGIFTGMVTLDFLQRLKIHRRW